MHLFCRAAQPTMFITLTLSWVDGGNPQTPQTEQRRQRSCHQSHALFKEFSVSSLDCRGTWSIEEVETLTLRQSVVCVEAEQPGYTMVWSVAEQ